MSELRHHFVETRGVGTNGLRMHIAEQGEGPLVILCHGFPECWYSWRHQLPALAEAGYRAVAPDQRGYGQSDRPEAVEAYDLLQLTGDIVGLVHALGEERAIVVGHDWGAPVATHCALLRPDLFHAVALLSAPFKLRAFDALPPSEALRQAAGDKTLYVEYFREPGKVEAELEADVRQTILRMLYGVSADVPPEQRWRFVLDEGETFLDTLPPAPERLPAWLQEEDIDVYVRAFERSGFRGGVNWYRNADRLFELTPFLAGAKLRQPTLFLAGAEDPVAVLNGAAIESMESAVPDLRGKHLLPGAGHWVQQEKPTEVNRLLLDFLAQL